MNHSRQTPMELKVCEGCGALWLRAGCPGAGPALHAATANVYCKRCVRLWAEFPAPRGPKKNSRTRVRIRTRKPAGFALVPTAAAPTGGAR